MPVEKTRIAFLHPFKNPLPDIFFTSYILHMGYGCVSFSEEYLKLPVK